MNQSTINNELVSMASIHVLDAQARLADAQSAEIAALADYQISLVDLAYATGTLIGASNVEWQPLRPDPDGP
ncbi:MAG: TolC family protein [Sedimentisphaerales bacterium]|jgi:hypothetical protein|nr:TolC family protein [Sedimentisphaerales bacterium]